MPGTLAIDLGSTTTVVAWQEHGRPPRLISPSPYALEQPQVVPSLVWVPAPEAGPAALVGRQVLEAGLAEDGGPGLCRDFKRSIGLDPSPRETGRDTAPEAAGCWLSPEQAAALLLHRIWAALPTELCPERLVLTAPIESGRGYRRWLRQVCSTLPVPELALVDEPTAAAIGAGLPAGSRVLVVDVGGGTIDLCLVELAGGEGRAAPMAQLLRFAGRDLDAERRGRQGARVIGKAGLPLGGRDLDRWIAAELAGGGSTDPGSDPELLRLAESIKCELSDNEEAMRIWAPMGQAAQELRLTRRRFEALLQERGLPERLEALLEAVWAGARRHGLSAGAVDAVLPVGGGSRIPLIRRWLEERCPGVPLRDERPVEAVALGALALTPGVRLRDVLARGVSLRCWDRRSQAHRWHPLFVAGQPWPTERPLELVLACSRQEQQELELVLGEPEAADRSEVVFLDGLPVLRRRPAGAPAVEAWREQPAPLPLDPPGQLGEDRLRLRFGIDAEARLILEGEDLANGRVIEPRPLGPVR